VDLEMDKLALKHYGMTFLDVIGIGGIIERAEEYHCHRKIVEAEDTIKKLCLYLVSLKEYDNNEAAVAYIKSVFEDDLAKLLCDDLLINLLNSPNEITRPYVVWIYANCIHQKEKPDRRAIRLIKTLLDCDENEVNDLKHFVRKMKKAWKENIKTCIVRYEIQPSSDADIVHMSITDIYPLDYTFEHEKKWTSWYPEGRRYWAIIDILKRFGVTQEVPPDTSGDSNTKAQMLVSSEAAKLLFVTFSLPDFVDQDANPQP
jgi:hypothetical protein